MLYRGLSNKKCLHFWRKHWNPAFNFIISKVISCPTFVWWCWHGSISLQVHPLPPPLPSCYACAESLSNTLPVTGHEQSVDERIGCAVKWWQPNSWKIKWIFQYVNILFSATINLQNFLSIYSQPFWKVFEWPMPFSSIKNSSQTNPFLDLCFAWIFFLQD